MNAQEAKAISEKKQIGLDQCLELIKKTAEDGYTQIMISNIDPNAITKLMKLKYRISIHTDIYNGMESHVCTWK